MTTKATILLTLVLLVVCILAFNYGGWLVLIPLVIGVALGCVGAFFEVSQNKSEKNCSFFWF